MRYISDGQGFCLNFFNMQNREKIQRHDAHTLLPSPISPLACFTVTVGSMNSKNITDQRRLKKKKRQALYEHRQNKCSLTGIKRIGVYVTSPEEADLFLRCPLRAVKARHQQINLCLAVVHSLCDFYLKLVLI